MSHSPRFRPQLQTLEDRSVPAGLIAIGADAGGAPHVKAFDATSNALVASFYAFDPRFGGGVRVAVGDVNGDGILDIVAGMGLNGSTQVVVIDGTRLNQVQANGQIANSALIGSFLAFGVSLPGGVFVAAGDLNNDQRDDIIVGAGPGAGPHVIAVDALRLNLKLNTGQIAPNALLASFYAFDPNFRGGVRVAVGDLNSDQQDDIVVGVASAGTPRVIAVDGTLVNQTQPNGQIASNALISSFFAYDQSFLGGVNVGAADVNGDGIDDIITGPEAGLNAEVRTFVNGARFSSTFPLRTIFGNGYNGAVRVAGVDTDFNGRAEIWAGGGPGVISTTNSTDPMTGIEFLRITPFSPNFLGGIFIDAKLNRFLS